jgi:hypothetical protein
MSPYLQGADFPKPSKPQYGPERWRQFITDPELLTNKKLCADTKNCESDRAAVEDIKLDFAAFVTQGVRQGNYSTNIHLTYAEFFADSPGTPAISCIANPPPAPPSAENTDPSPLRVRGVASDLYILRNDPAFTTTSKATANFTGDTSAKPWTQTAKFQAAVGYAIDTSTEENFSAIIPYATTNVSITDTQAKPRTKGQYNFFGGGVLFSEDIGGQNYISLMPQYLEETTQRAQVASLRAIYAPWPRAKDSAPFPPLNTPFPVGVYSLSGQILFDLRADLGMYPERGDPAFAHMNQPFARFGTRTGIALSTAQSAQPTSVAKCRNASHLLVSVCSFWARRSLH